MKCPGVAYPPGISEPGSDDTQKITAIQTRAGIQSATSFVRSVVRSVTCIETFLPGSPAASLASAIDAALANGACCGTLAAQPDAARTSRSRHRRREGAEREARSADDVAAV